jgi:capsular polysaccharide export protein
LPSSWRAILTLAQVIPMSADACLLRAPPFPGRDASVSYPVVGPAAGDPAPAGVERLFAAIREARVGGDFWKKPGQRHPVIARVRSAGDARLVPDAAIAEDVDPWSVLGAGTMLIAHPDDEWVAIATIAGSTVRLFPDMADPDAAALSRRVARDLTNVRYRDPFTGAEARIEATIDLLADWRRTIEGNRAIVAGCGFSWWKRREIARFLWSPWNRLRFFRSEGRAIAYAARQGGAVAVWPSRIAATMPKRAAEKNVPLVRVEDGFVRSVGLGSNLVPPSSVAVDRRGIHYDPARPSDLETLLAEAVFPPALLARAERLRDTILAAGISKYESGGTHRFPERIAGRRLVLVAGQVEDDMSVLLGGGGLSSNLELVRRARALEPTAEIWFRPHPDVEAGHRKGAVRDADALRFADRIVRGGGMASLLDQVDAVHVLTSLTGFEALLRDRDVTCHGTPFFAGWGLTRDLAPVPDRRGRQLTIAELAAAVLILYPRYLDPVTGLPCPPEILVGRMGEGAAANRLDWVSRLKQVQGRLVRKRR